MDHGGCMEARPSRRGVAGHGADAGSSTTKRAPAPCRVGSSGSTHCGSATRTEIAWRLTVARPNPSAVSLDNLARNRQSKARVLTEPLLWSIRIKSLEYSLQRMRRDSRAVIVDRDDDAVDGRLPLLLSLGRLPLERDAHDAAGLGEGAGVINEVGDDLRKTRVMPEDEIVCAGAPAPPDRDR